MIRFLTRWAAVCVFALSGIHAHADHLRDFITNLYGGDGIILPLAPGIPENIAQAHQPHFTGPEQIAELNALSDGILSGTGIFAFNSTVTGVSFDLSTGVPQTVQDSLGPLLAERATTLGDGRWTFGVGYTYQKFDELDGQKLSDLQVTFHHEDCCQVGPPPIPPPDGQLTGFEEDTILIDVDVQLKQQVVALFSNYGVTDNFDIGLVVPIVKMEASADAVATIQIANPDSGSTIDGFPVHSFANDPSAAFDSTGGSKTGIGDIIGRAKWHFLDASQSFADMAVFVDVTAPTGDEKDLLGTGEWQFRGVYVISKNIGRWTPHLNVGWSGASGNTDALNKVTYAAGFDSRLSPQFTFSADVLGRYNYDLKTIGNHVVDFAVAAKWNPFRNRNMPLNAFVSVPLNDDGLRAKVIWGLGFDVIL
ncbi:MAG: transporter [Pseudomonadales bacterium]|jgi:hypothetical protein